MANLESEFDRQGRKSANSVATSILCWYWGIAWICLLTFAVSITMAHRDFGNAIAGLFMLFWLGPVVGIFASLVGEVIGWASWQVAGKSTIPPDRLSGAIAHLLIFAVFGWILVLMFSGR